MDKNRRYEQVVNKIVNKIAHELYYDGGWRAEDKDWMMEEYGYTEEEVTLICKKLKDFEEGKS